MAQRPLRRRTRDQLHTMWWRLRHWSPRDIDWWEAPFALLALALTTCIFALPLRAVSHWPAWVDWPVAAAATAVVVLAISLVMRELEYRAKQYKPTTRTTGVRRAGVVAAGVSVILTPLWMTWGIFKSVRQGLHMATVSHSPWRWLLVPAVAVPALYKAFEKWPDWVEEAELRLELRAQLASAGPLATELAELAVRHDHWQALEDAIGQHVALIPNAAERCANAAWAFKQLARKPDLAPRRLAPYWEEFGRLESALHSTERALTQKS